ncbi:hypothetical protein [Campylobacter concisus]|uniref:hypothetical protein n=1 Tax=Campylobacter concisus TaxID=199 RepID=UPI00131CD3E5|nr:hypothetical protein [Campylobacter concisus]
MFFVFCSRGFWFFLCGSWLTARVPYSSWLLVKFCKAILDIKVIKGIEKSG